MEAGQEVQLVLCQVALELVLFLVGGPSVKLRLAALALARLARLAVEDLAVSPLELVTLRAALAALA